MVTRRPIALCFLLLLTTVWPLRAQNYSVTDTVTEYPNKGTFYHDLFEGRKTASGEIFDQNKFTAAHWRIKLGTYVMVTNQNSGLQVIVKVNDRCPKRGVFDMSHRAAKAIGIRGMQPVTIRILPDGYEDRWAAQETVFDSVHSRLNPKTSPQNITIESLLPNSDSKRGNDCYNLLLGTASNHGEVFTMTRRLPAAYRDRVNVESLDASDSLRVTLDVRLSKKQAEQLTRTLRNTFPKAQLILAD
ncbi:MAG: septal ring lytic transglycosylase RlpA family protein [Bacteroidales bacterium]|nr:septal ring lytic transglycosylase RlpA family protein [Bacteroidales bacterium]